MSSGAGTLVLASRNEHKLREFQEILEPLGVRVRSLNTFSGVQPVVEDGVSFKENALKKARSVAQDTGHACLADDSGLVVDALGGSPGIFSARYAGSGATDEDNRALLLEQMRPVEGARRDARFVAVIAYFDPVSGHEHSTEGVWEGHIAHHASGNRGFGYDPVFVPEGHNCTSAELNPGDKHRLSHRGQALRAMAQHLRELGV